jgi:hypothetical protein
VHQGADAQREHDGARTDRPAEDPSGGQDRQFDRGAGLADEVLVYLAPMLLGGPRLALDDLGVATMAEAQHLRIHRVEHLGDDLLVVARPVTTEG